MLDLEIVAVKCLDCEQMVWAGDDHPCWVEELGMRAFEDAMWARYQAEVAIEPLEEGFFVGQHVYERDTFAPGTITAIDEDGIAEVLFSNGSTDGLSLEDLTTSADPRREEF